MIRTEADRRFVRNMVFNIPKSDLVTEKNTTPDTEYRYSAEASELGLKPGQWPMYLNTTLGNGEPFRRCTNKGEYVIYIQDLSAIPLHVWND